MFQRVGQQEKRREPLSEDEKTTKSATFARSVPKFSEGSYWLEAERWFGRGRVLAKERVSGFTAPVLGLLPGEHARCRVDSGLLRDARLEVLDESTRSPWRVVPPCAQAHVCPGCSQQQVSLEGRTHYLRTLVWEVLQRYGEQPTLPFDDVDVWMGAEGGHRVRSKVWMRPLTLDTAPLDTADDGAVQAQIGMRQRGDRNLPLVDFVQCMANAEILREAMDALRGISISREQWKAWQQESPALELEWTGEVLFLIAEEWPTPWQERALDVLRRSIGEKWAVDVQLGAAERPWTHVNPTMQNILYYKASHLLDWEGRNVFDLTCGDGGFTFYIAERGATVFASDRHWEAVQRTALEAERRGETRVYTRGGDALSVLQGSRRRGEKADVIVINPMREPLGELVMNEVFDSEATELLYLAPAPKAGAKDISVLARKGWTLRACAAVDLHPWTGQCMMVAVMQRQLNVEKC